MSGGRLTEQDQGFGASSINLLIFLSTLWSGLMVLYNWLDNPSVCPARALCGLLSVCCLSGWRSACLCYGFVQGSFQAGSRSVWGLFFQLSLLGGSPVYQSEVSTSDCEASGLSC